MRAVCGLGFVVVVATTSAAAGPLGPMWRAKLSSTTCPELTETADGLLWVHDGVITRFDRATGAISTVALPKLGPHATGSFHVEQVTGSTAVVEYFTGATFGVDVKTHAIVWTRDHDPADHATSQSMHSAGHDLVLAHLVHAPYAITMERFDAETGATKWTAAVPTKRAIIDKVVATTEHVYVITREYGSGRAGSTITALDRTGKVAWAIDDPAEFWQPSVVGEDLVLIRDDKIRRYAAATGALTSFDVDWNAQPLQAGGSVYTTPVDDTLEAFDLAGKQRWSTALPPRGAGMPRFAAAIGVVHGLVYVEDGQVLRTFDETTGAAVASFGTGYGDPFHTVRMHATAPTLTRCDRRELVALDPTAPAIDHHVTVRGRIRCTNCDKTTRLEVRLGDAAVDADARGRFTIDTTASGVLELEVRDRGFSSAASVKRIDFGHDRTLELGTLRVKVPEMSPGED